MIISEDNQAEVEKRLRNLTELYLVVKELILYFEEVNPEQKSDIQPINELRNAFDHMMRVSAVALEISPQDDSQKYILTHIDKAFGHVYRAGYDTVDFLSLTIKAAISEDLDGFSVDAISKALPEYYSTIKPKIERINQKIAHYRAKKDVAQNDAEHLIEYIGTVKNLCEYRNQVNQALPSIAEIDKKRKDESRTTARQDWIKRIVIGIILIVLGALLRPLFTNIFTEAGNSPTKTPYSNQAPSTKPASK